MNQLKGLVLIILGGLFVISMIKGLISLGFKKVDAPRHYSDYASAAVRGRDPFKGPGKPIIASILGGIWTLFLWILRIPQKIAEWALSNYTELKGYPRIILSYTIAVIFWTITTLIILWWVTAWYLKKQTDVGVPTPVLFLLFSLYDRDYHFFFLEYFI